MKIIQHPSPNFREAKKRDITLVVLHATATSKIGSPLEWLCDKESEKSAHYLIDTNGDIYQLVQEDNIAWHGGFSEWKGKQDPRHSVNGFSIGIEMVNPNDGITTYPDAQMDAVTELCHDILARRKNLTPGDFVGHLQVATPLGRKNDPAGFDLEAFRNSLEVA